MTGSSRRRARAASSLFLRVTVALSGVALIAAARHTTSAATPPAVAHLFSLVRPVFSGDRALSTVAFVEQRWRWPGNRGFEESIDHVAEQLRSAGYVDEKAA